MLLKARRQRPACRSGGRSRSGFSFGVGTNDQPVALVLAETKFSHGGDFGRLLIRCLDGAEIFATAAHDDDAPASQIGGLFGGDTPGHAGKITAGPGKSGVNISRTRDRLSGEQGSWCYGRGPRRD